MDVYVLQGRVENGTCYFLPSGSEQMLKHSVSGWGTAGACCKSVQHQQLHEPQPHGSPGPLLGGSKSTVVATRRAGVGHEQGDGGKAGEEKTRHCDCLKHLRVQTAWVSEPRCQVFPRCFAACSPGL